MKQKVLFELTWVAITIVLLAMVLMPIIMSVGNAYPFYIENILVVIIAVTFSRYIFLLKHHWISGSRWYKLFFIFFPIVVFFFLLDSFYDFQRFCDEEGIRSIMSDLHASQQGNLAIYIRTEMVLFWAAAFLSNLIMPFRMIISIWRKINKGTH